MIPASVDIFKASRMKQIEDTTVVSGLVDSNGHLLLKTRANQSIDAGNVVGPEGLGFRSRGEWAATTPYLKNDIVTSAGSTFLVTVPHTSGNTAPTPQTPGPNLTLWAIKGTDGVIGKDGSTAIPAGTVSLWTGTTTPVNWMICDGSAVSRTAYASLFDAIGVKYGAGDGVNTFNLPNLKGRVPVGQDTAQTEFDVLGETGGAKTHTLLTGEMPAHTHTYVNGPLYKNVVVQSGSGNTGMWGGADSTAIATSSAGSGTPHNNLQPYTVVNFIIKVTAGETPNDSELTQRISALETQFSATPAGTITGWGGTAAPTNWLLCDGSAVSRTLYPSLFAAIGTTYGAGNGTTTFNLPDLRGRVPTGRDATQTEFDVLGETGGAKTHTHKHVSPVGMANGNIYTLDISNAQVDIIGSYDINDVLNTSRYSGGSASNGPGAMERHFVTSSASGTLAPYQVINYIIKFTNGDVKGDSQLTQRVSVVEAGTNTAMLIKDKIRRSQVSLTGGGKRVVGDGNVSWNKAFYTMGAGRDPQSPSGWFAIDMPPDGTVIPVLGHPTVTSITVGSLVAGRISFNSLSVWAALYYDIPIGGVGTSVPSRFKIIDYSSGSVPIPDSWILVGNRNVDGFQPEWKWGDGQRQDWWRSLTFMNGWRNYDALWAPCQWRFASDGAIICRGLCAAGTAPQITSFSAALSPPGASGAGEIFLVQSANGMARIDMTENGIMNLNAYMSGGSNAYVSLANVRWYPKDT